MATEDYRMFKPGQTTPGYSVLRPEEETAPRTTTTSQEKKPLKPEISTFDDPNAKAAQRAADDVNAKVKAKQTQDALDKWRPGIGLDANAPETDASQERIGAGPSLTRGQADDINTKSSQALTWWNQLGTVGEIKEIQKLVGATPDGKIGPQTLAKIYIKLGGENSDALSHSNFQKGKQGVYNPLEESINRMKSLSERMERTNNGKGSILL